MIQICVPSGPSWYAQCLSTTGPSFWASHSYFYVSWYEHGNARLVHILRFFPHPVFEDHLYCYVIFWYEHGNARLVHLLRWSLIHYWGYVLFSPCRWFEIGVPDFSCFLLFSTPQHKPNMTHDVHRPYDELLPSHIRGQSVNTQKWLTTSSTPLHGSFVHLPTIFLWKSH